MSNGIRLMRGLALLSYLGLFILLIAWMGWLAPLQSVSKPVAILLFVGPLLFPLPGILRGKPYTHAWTAFLVLIYFMHAIVELWADAQTRYLSAIELVLSLTLFSSALLYARWQGKQLKIKNTSHAG